MQLCGQVLWRKGRRQARDASTVNDFINYHSAVNALPPA
jgi:hypothetical protein